MSETSSKRPADSVILGEDAEEIELIRSMSEIQEKALSIEPPLNSRQIDLFSLDSTDAPGDVSNTIYLYDSIPKHSHNGREFSVSQSAFSMAEFTFDKHQYVCEIQAARIRRKDGSEVLMFPSEREELVEEALLKIAASGGICSIEGHAGVVFTLGQVSRLLSHHGHTFSMSQVKEALVVLNTSNLRVSRVTGGQVDGPWSSSFLTQLGFGRPSKKDIPDGDDQRCVASFHVLVTKSLRELSFRAINYEVLMNLKSQLARHIYKLMCTQYTYASHDRPYNPTMNQMLTLSGRGLSQRTSSNIRAINDAMAALKKAGVILNVEEKKRYFDESNKRRVNNISYDVWPTQKFIDHQIWANSHSKALKSRNAIGSTGLPIKRNKRS